MNTLDTIFSHMGKVRFHHDTVVECYNGCVTSVAELNAAAVSAHIMSRNIKSYLAGNFFTSDFRRVYEVESSLETTLTLEIVQVANFLITVASDLMVSGKTVKDLTVLQTAAFEALAFECFDSSRKISYIIIDENPS